MATTGIWKIEKRLDHVINYVVNSEKTTISDNDSYQELHKLLDSNLDYTNEEECYISALNCSTHRTYNNMMLTKHLYGKNNGILGYHAFQSFKGGEVTPDKAHIIGVKLAEEMWGDNYEVLITTHINTNCIHNHFVINSVGFKDGKKYHDCRENMALLRHTSDSLCEEYGLSVLDSKECKKGKVNYDNYYKGFVSKTNYHTLAKEDVDRAIGMAVSFKDFENIMTKMGYELINRYGKLSIKREPFKKNIRIERAFGCEYSIDKISERIQTTSIPKVPFIESSLKKNKAKKIIEQKHNKAHGLYGLYKYYCYILKIYPKENPNRMLTPALRLELNKMNELSEQTRMLASNKIETYEQLLLYKNNINDNVSKLVGNKHNLWIKYKRIKNDNDKQVIFNEIESITQKLIPLRKEAKLCDGIEKNIEKIKENIREFEEEKGKEKTKNEF